MNITATLIAQIIAFVILIFMVKRLLWGPLTEALQKRRDNISEGLLAADKGKKELVEAQQKITQIEADARTHASEIISNSEKRANEIIEEAKLTAEQESQRIKKVAQSDIDKQVEQARQTLSSQVSKLAIIGAQRILEKEIDQNVHTNALKELENRI